jgi:hypothetical protein
MATDNIFAGTITCTGMTVNGAITVTGAIASSTGFVGPFLSAASATGVGTAGNPVALIATAGTNGVATGGNGGNASVTAGNGGTGTTGGNGGSVNVTAGNGGATNGNGGSINLTPGAPDGTGVRGLVNIGGPLRSSTRLNAVTETQSINTGDTILLPALGFNTRVATSTAADKTGVILTPGTADGQTINIINTSANSITFAAVGTSNVADGVLAVIPALRAMIFTWVTATSRWYRQGA